MLLEIPMHPVHPVNDHLGNTVAPANGERVFSQIDQGYLNLPAVIAVYGSNPWGMATAKPLGIKTSSWGWMIRSVSTAAKMSIPAAPPLMYRGSGRS